RSMTVGGRVGALSYLFEPVGGQLARLVRRQFSDAAERKPARPAFLIPVLHDKRRNAARLHSHAETLQRAIARVPFEHVAARAIGTQSIDKAFGELGHWSPLKNLLPRGSF